jgi:hypothetical protein
MKKLCLICVLVTTGMLLAFAGSAQGACNTARCINKKINGLQATVSSLQGQVGSLTSQVATLNTCLKRAPVTSYDGYDYTSGSYDGTFTTALDFTLSGDPISSWMVSIQPGTCGTSSFATASARSAQGPFRSLQVGPGVTK